MRASIDGRALSFVLLSGLAVIACGGGAIATGTPATTAASPTPSPIVATLQPSVNATPSPSSSPLASPSASATTQGGGPGGTGTLAPTSIDPCTLLKTEQASAVNGVSYPAGVSHVLDNGAAECVWQTSTPPSSVVVQLAVAPSVTEAQIAYAESQAQLKGSTIEKLTGFADEAVIARAAGGGLTTGGIYVREGATFYDLVYLNGTVPTDDQLKGYAQIILGNLPGS